MEENLSKRLSQAVGDAFAVNDITLGRPEGGREAPVRLRGHLLMEAAEAYERIAPRFRALNYTPFLRREGDFDVIQATPGVIEAMHAPRIWINVLLFLATVVSVLFVGAWLSVKSMEELIANPLAGFPFASSLLGILLAHEFGHYLMARYHGVPASLPYFIPVPLPPLGTFGAFINMKAPVKNRRALLGIGAAGPLAGFAIAIPVLILGLSLSKVEPLPEFLPPGTMIMMEGNSLLYLAIKFIMFGRILPSGGVDVNLHPVAFAGWAGLLVTALNLLPAGQLDGGHIVYALLREKARKLAWVIIVALLGLGILWDGWFLWAVLIFFLGRRPAMLLDEITSLNGPQRALAVMVVILFILIFTPIPMRVLGG